MKVFERQSHVGEISAFFEEVRRFTLNTSNLSEAKAFLSYTPAVVNTILTSRVQTREQTTISTFGNR